MGIRGLGRAVLYPGRNGNVWCLYDADYADGALAPSYRLSRRGIRGAGPGLWCLVRRTGTVSRPQSPRRIAGSSLDTTAVTPVRGPHAPRPTPSDPPTPHHQELQSDWRAFEMSTTPQSERALVHRVSMAQGLAALGLLMTTTPAWRRRDWLCGLRDRRPEADIQRSVCACGKGWFPSGFPIADLGILVGTSSS